MVIEPLTPFHDALTAALPLPSAVTSPALETPATLGAPVDQAKVTLEVTSPSRGLVAVAESCTVWFRLENDVEPDAVTEMVSTYTAEGSTVIAPPEVDETAPTVAMALAMSPLAALEETAARPSVPMVATAGLLVVQTGAGAPTTA